MLQVNIFFILMPLLVMSLLIPARRSPWLTVPLKIITALITSYTLLFTLSDYLLLHYMGQTLHLADIFFLDDLLSLIRDNTNVLVFILSAVLCVILPFLFVCIMYLIISKLHSLLQSFRYRFITGQICLLILIAVSVIKLPDSRLWITFEEALNSKQYREQLAAEFQEESLSRQEVMKAGMDTTRTESVTVPPPPPLDKLNNAHVFYFIVESYGRTLTENPSNWKTAEPHFKNQYTKLVKNGFHMATQTFQSPAIGGHSWLADSTMNTGLWIESQAAYDELVKTDVPVLSDYFKTRGYTTVLAQPGTRESGPEKEFYNFDHTLIREDFKYRGPTFRWPTMTDQYVLHFIDQAYVKDAVKPLFIEYMLISSHYPFQLIPVYEPDWNKLNRGRIYRNPEYVISMPVPEGKNTAGPEGLTQGLLYTLQTVTEYLMKLEDNNFLAIITGDHQPVKRVTGKWGEKNVIFHVVSRNRAFIEPFLGQGFSEGYYREADKNPPRMDTILPLILNQMSSRPVLPARKNHHRPTE